MSQCLHSTVCVQYIWCIYRVYLYCCLCTSHWYSSYWQQYLNQYKSKVQLYFKRFCSMSPESDFKDCGDAQNMRCTMASSTKQAGILTQHTHTLTGNLFLSVQRGHTQGWAAASGFTTGVSLDCLCHAVNFTGARLACTTARLQHNKQTTEKCRIF